MKLSGDKAKAREVASRIAPILKGKEVSTESDALNLAEEIGYPVILKAVKGGAEEVSGSLNLLMISVKHSVLQRMKRC